MITPNVMLCLLPPLAYVALVFILVRTTHTRLGPGRAAVDAAVFILTFLALVTECLSLVRALTFPAILTVWAGGAFALLALALRAWRRGPTGPPVQLDSLTVALLAAAATVAVPLLIIALAAPPNTWDSMTYHVPRVCHWLQAGSVAHYPTHNLRQLYLAPFAEYLLLHVMALSGGDVLCNLVQWGAMCGSCLVVGLVALELGAPRWGIGLGAALCVSIPMGVLQSTSTQNDYVCALLLVVTVYYVVRMVRRADLLTAFMLGCAYGLACMTKSTALIFGAPFIVWVLVALICTRPRPRAAALQVSLMALPVLALNGPFLLRNWLLFGAPLGVHPLTNPDVCINESFSVVVLLSNLIRNAALHLQTPWTSVAHAIVRVVEGLHVAMGIGVSDPGSTFQGTAFSRSSLLTTTNGDLSGNCAHALLLLACVVIVLGSRVRHRPRLGAYVACLAAGAVLFCAGLKWQPWHSRLHLPFFVLSVPFMVAALASSVRRWPATVVAGVLLLLALPWVLTNASRPLVGSWSVLNVPRAEQYFVERPALTRGYVRAVLDLLERESGTAGLELGGDDWEYPFWALTAAAGGRVGFVHVGVSNVSQRCYSDAPLDGPVLRVRGGGLSIEVDARDSPAAPAHGAISHGL